MPPPPSYRPNAPSPLAQSFAAADAQGGDGRGAQESHSAGTASSSGYPADLAVANRRQAAQLQAKAQLQNHFKDLENLPPGSSESYGEKIEEITYLLSQHEGLAYDALDMCGALKDDEKKCMVHMQLSGCLRFLPFEDGQGSAFASDILEHHDALPSEQQKPVSILCKLFECADRRIAGLSSESMKNHEALEWCNLVISGLHKHKDKIRGGENNDFASDPKVAISGIIKLLGSCLKPGSTEESAVLKGLKEGMSKTFSSQILPILENLPWRDKISFYTTLLKKIPNLLGADKQGKFVLDVLAACTRLMDTESAELARMKAMETMTTLAEKIGTFTFADPSQKAKLIETTRITLLGNSRAIGDLFKARIIKALSPYQRELEGQERSSHISELQNIANTIRNQSLKETARLWVNNPGEAERIDREARQRVAAQMGPSGFSDHDDDDDEY